MIRAFSHGEHNQSWPQAILVVRLGLGSKELNSDGSVNIEAYQEKLDEEIKIVGNIGEIFGFTEQYDDYSQVFDIEGFPSVQMVFFKEDRGNSGLQVFRNTLYAAMSFREDERKVVLLETEPIKGFDI